MYILTQHKIGHVFIYLWVLFDMWPLKKYQFSQEKTKTTTLPSPLLLTTACRWRKKNNRSEADTNGTHIRRNYNDPDPTEKGYRRTNGLIGASKGMSPFLFLNSLSFVQSIYLHMHVKIHFIIQLYLNHMNRRENKNEAEAAVGDNIGKVFPKFYLMASYDFLKLFSPIHIFI